MRIIPICIIVQRTLTMKYILLLSLILTPFQYAWSNDSEVNLYSARKEQLITPLLEAFTQQTGIKVNIITSKADALLQRIIAEGKNSPADVLLTTDAGRLHRALEANVLAPIDSTTLENNVPAHLRDPNGHWYGLSLRARPIMVTDKANTQNLSDYQDLTRAEYQNQICIRSSSNIYNQSLVAAMIENQGIEVADQWAKGLVANMARRPQGGDTDQIRAAAAGQCSIAIANTYYLGRMLDGEPDSKDYKAASKIRVIWPNQSSSGTHVNVSGAGVIKTAPNRSNAIKLIEFLSSDAAQKIYADVNFEYPIRDNIEVNSILSAWGNFKADNINLSVLGSRNPDAVKSMDRAGWQ